MTSPTAQTHRPGGASPGPVRGLPKPARRRRPLLVVVGLVLAAAACSPHVRVVAPQAVPGALPFLHDGQTSRAEIRGVFTTVEVEQRFHNPFDTKIEAVYVFPLPEGAAVHDFLMKIGERTIRGIVREREEAEQIYREAKGLGYVASLLTEERPNVFTQKVANIEPGKEIDVTLKYFHTLDYVDGWYEFVFPMVVGPRYIPGTPSGAAQPTPAELQGKVSPTVADTDRVPDLDTLMAVDTSGRVRSWRLPSGDPLPVRPPGAAGRRL